jgi:hypothetical protein
MCRSREREATRQTFLSPREGRVPSMGTKAWGWTVCPEKKSLSQGRCNFDLWSITACDRHNMSFDQFNGNSHLLRSPENCKHIVLRSATAQDKLSTCRVPHLRRDTAFFSLYRLRSPSLAFSSSPDELKRDSAACRKFLGRGRGSTTSPSWSAGNINLRLVRLTPRKGRR